MVEESRLPRTSRPSSASPRQLSSTVRILATFGGSAAILISGAMAYMAAESADEARDLVAHTQSVLETAAATMSAVQDAETGQRGYLITGDTIYLEPYKAAVKLIEADTLNLRELTQDNPSHQQRVDTLESLVTRKLAELESTIALRRTGSDAEVERVMRRGHGRVLMDSIRAVIGAINTEERRLLAARDEGADRSARYAITVLVAGTFAAIVCALLLNGMLSRMATDQARAAEKLSEQIELVEAANSAKSDFLAAVSHELRTPLNAIDGYTELLLLGLRGELTEDQRGDVTRIKRSSRHLLTLINQVLNMAKIESGQIDLELSVVPVQPLLQDVEVLIGPQMKAKQIVFATSDCDVPARIYADPDRVKQILLNLVSNAQKFTPAGGAVTVKCADSGSMLMMDVIDTGHGIPRDKLGEIFEPFTQLNRLQTPDSHRGIGLGLSISRTLARAMGGDLSVESEVGKGSTFRLTLPTSPPR